ncbi:MAG: hypothetical protein KF788_07075 [Piscinibacter sp.]|nr:hypothetical protein [Piscinibacter sp.]
MGTVTEVLATAKKPDDVAGVEWDARSRVSILGTPLKDTKVDAAKIGEKMKKAKKSAEFILTYDGRKLVYGIRVGSDLTTIDSLDVAGERDLAKRRQWLVKIKKSSKVVTAADLDAFDKVNPIPADPKEIAEVEQQIDVAKSVIKSEQDVKSWYAKKYADFDWQQRRLDFLPWAKKQGFEAYAQFMIGVTDGFQDYAMMKTHVLKGAPLPVKLQPATRAAMEKAFAADQKVDYAAAKAEVLKIVDGALMPKFRALRFKEAEKTVEREKKRLADLEKQLVKLKGRK